MTHTAEQERGDILASITTHPGTIAISGTGESYIEASERATAASLGEHIQAQHKGGENG